MTEKKEEQKVDFKTIPHTTAFVEEIEEDGVKQKLFVASDEVVDRQGEVLSTDGWKLDNFKKNPVILWAHNQLEPAIGIAEKIGFKTVQGVKKLVFEPKFHRKSDISRLIADLVDEGWIKASSVGFLPIERDDKVYKKQELLEISFVNVPANQNALGLALSKGYSPEVIKQIMPDVKDEDICPPQKDVEDIEFKGAIPYTKYPLADENVEWDAGAEVRNADVDDLKKMCAWYDSANPDLKGSYKLPHHQLSGYKTVWRGVSAAMAALMGARGGVQIPDSDRMGVYNHLKRHYADFDKEPPELRTADQIIEKYVENRSADDSVRDLIKLVNTYIEEGKVAELGKSVEELKIAIEKFIDDSNKANAEQKAIQESERESLEKRIKGIELNIQGLSEGIKPGDEGLEARIAGIERNFENLTRDIKSFLDMPVKGTNGRELKSVEGEDKKSMTRRHLIYKALNKSVEALNLLEKE